MTEKIIVFFYNILSAAIHFGIVLMILSVPVLFALTANSPLAFKLNSLSVEKADEQDEFLAAKGFTADGWYKINYDMKVSSSRFSPYRYTVKSFALKSSSEIKKYGSCLVKLDAPLDFTSTKEDSFVLTLYIQSSADKSEIEALAKSAGFGTREITRCFSFFEEEIEASVPGFNVSELIA